MNYYEEFQIMYVFITIISSTMLGYINDLREFERDFTQSLLL
jgi:hypothetical protein